MRMTSSLHWLRYCELMHVIRHGDYHGIPTVFTEEDKNGLLKIFEEIDVLHSDSEHVNTQVQISERDICIPNSTVVQRIEVSSDVSGSAELFERIHGIVQNYWIGPRVYRELGGSYKEIGATPTEDTRLAIEYGTSFFEYQSGPMWRFRGSNDKMHWAKLKENGEIVFKP